MTTEEPMLEACPFCGCHGLSSAYPRIIRERACGVVECHTDSCGAMVVADTLPHALVAWNRRAGAGDVREALAAARRTFERIERIAGSGTAVQLQAAAEIGAIDAALKSTDTGSGG